jgi:hypothetical protein
MVRAVIGWFILAMLRTYLLFLMKCMIAGWFLAKVCSAAEKWRREEALRRRAWCLNINILIK